MNPTSPKRIAVLRTAALGDICMTIPLLIALRDHFPDSEIFWILDANMSTLVDDLAGIHLIKIKKPRSLKDWRRAQQQLSHYKFDALLMPQSSLRSNLLSLFIKAKTKYGYGKLHSKDCQSWFIDQPVHSVEEHLVDSFLRFAEALGVPQAKPRWEIQLSNTDQTKAVELLPDTSRPIIAICPVSSKGERNWPAERFASVATQLQKVYGAQIILVGGADQSSLEACAAIKAKASAIDASNQTSLKELCAVLKRADMLIAPDTGPAHLANAMGTPVVGLYAVMKAPKTGPYYSVNHCVDCYDEAVKSILNQDPSTTSWNLRVHSPQAMLLIQADAVYARCCQVLKLLGYSPSTAKE
jgi:heptosyltransferase I